MQQLRALEASEAAVAIDDKTSGIVADHQSRRHHDVTTATAAGLRLGHEEDQFADIAFGGLLLYNDFSYTLSRPNLMDFNATYRGFRNPTGELTVGSLNPFPAQIPRGKIG